ncbi:MULTISPECIES: AAA family ATPase [Pseudomonas]|uniref:ATP-binding protein n=1 Tax=Pseudomonas peradeniyensis TaxID=2745488 RepID=A0ABT2VAB4_9PSED|nr:MULTISPECIES: AAA family ATPase [Pseudomonas]MCU7238669.1 ATP-binding protein [Pseudomonas peradeniyensis]MCU7280161.1 ATP-binding protein [Pseudomonas peradeniyensis]
MNMRFIVGNPNTYSGGDAIVLLPNTGWNDYRFVTTFYAYLVRRNVSVRLGEVKIGFVQQDPSVATYKELEPSFTALGERYFSLGQNPEYYENVRRKLGAQQDEFFIAMRDVAYNERVVPQVYEQRVFIESLSRFVSESSIKGHFKNIIDAGVQPRDYGFIYHHDQQAYLKFSVSSQSKPPSNVHALIGRNGVGKSHVLKRIARSIDMSDGVVTSMDGRDVTSSDFGLLLYFSLGIFGNPLGVAEFGDDRLKQGRTKKRYIGIYKEDGSLKRVDEEMGMELSESIATCVLGSDVKKRKWFSAVSRLQVGVDFGDLDVAALVDVEDKNELIRRAMEMFSLLSSGHATVLFYMTKVVELVEDKTICLFDEPENHLHPPLLAGFIRVLSEFLSESNGIAILATHSPVVLQEIPRGCVWRIDGVGQFMRPHIETFGESVGDITMDVFDLDRRHSGFYALLKQDAQEVGDYEGVMSIYKGQVGTEGRSVVLSSLPRER